MQIIKLQLQTANLAATKQFYTSQLGLPIIAENTTRISLEIGSSILVLEETQTGAPKYHFAFNIPNNQLDAALAWSRDRFAPLLAEGSPITFFEDWKAKSIYFYDNNENILEFIAREDLDNASDKIFDAYSLLNIGEVGIVTEKPLILGDTILARCPISYFSKGPVREDFVAIGDDAGLFVVSNTQRNWYPTSHRAEKWPVHAIVQAQNQRYAFEFNRIDN